MERIASGAAPVAPAEADLLPPAATVAVRSKKRRTGGLASDHDHQQQQQAEFVRLSGPLERGSERLAQHWRPVRLSEEDRSAAVALDEEHLTASSTKGYRMVRATHGAHSGTWYYEVRVGVLGGTGAARLGWATRGAGLEGPVGASPYCYAYRSLEGSKVHRGVRELYGQPYGEGDVVGCLIHLPEGSARGEATADDAVRYKGRLYLLEETCSGVPSLPPRPDPTGDAAEPAPLLRGSYVAFTLNGQPQGVAYMDLPEGTYYPALSLYTATTQTQAAEVTANFGEGAFAHAPPPPERGGERARPVAELPGPRPGAAVEAAVEAPTPAGAKGEPAAEAQAQAAESAAAQPMQQG